MELEKLKKIQEDLKKLVRLCPFEIYEGNVLGVDSAYLSRENEIISSAIVYNIESGEIIERSYAKKKISFPYIPGFLSFREIDSTLSAIEKISTDFKLIVVDGQGIAHPRRFGIASHIGVLLNKPTIGCAKKRLVGKFQIPENIVGAYNYLYDGDEKIGAVLRTKINAKPIFISPGNLIDIESSVKIIMELITKYRLPEPVREAHNYCNLVKRSQLDV